MRFQDLVIGMLIVFLLTPGVVFGQALGHIITAVAQGSPMPEESERSLRNGDFFITAIRGARTVGDGINEQTTWTFDFRSDPNTPSFPNGLKLSQLLS